MVGWWESWETSVSVRGENVETGGEGREGGTERGHGEGGGGEGAPDVCNLLIEEHKIENS